MLKNAGLCIMTYNIAHHCFVLKFVVWNIVEIFILFYYIFYNLYNIYKGQSLFRAEYLYQ